MDQVSDAPLPDGSLIAPFGEMEGHYTDAFRVRVAGDVDLAALIGAFYRTPLFRAERFVLRIAARAPSTDAELDALASGAAERFAAWSVEARRDDEILLSDQSGRTKSWLRIAPAEGVGTELWFGSVVVPVMKRGKLTLGPVFDALLKPHLIYSRALLGSAAFRLR